ncbi:hypothetical protein [Clostridium sp. C105KSO13]|uniref:hypothetical protein n=1 Tax=Clostridium sp. C105KSO13 TaxID=1776045 RepID=UPI0007406059|nr:hypothetical protein [Clostridium sp. C105KSO13]CUX45837.1 hypothetical protein BN3456_02547 [Clostridium sp. C105KSO13]
MMLARQYYRLSKLADDKMSLVLAMLKDMTRRIEALENKTALKRGLSLLNTEF